MIRRFLSSKEAEAEMPSGFDAYDLRLGDVMRGERATLGKSLLDVQRELKIKASFIAAIENSDPDAFDSPSFIAGYVRSYARYLGLDPEWAFQEFCKESDYQTAHGMSSEASSPSKVASKAAPLERRDPLSDPNAAFVPQRDSMFTHIEPRGHWLGAGSGGADWRHWIWRLVRVARSATGAIRTCRAISRCDLHG